MGTMKMRSLEYIAKQAADDAMNSLIFTLEDGREFSLREFADYVASGEIVPVRHGKWLAEKPNSYTRMVICSICSEYAPFICKSEDYYGRNMHGEFAKTRYCPNCGAKMDGGDGNAAD